MTDQIKRTLADPAASYWLKDALRTALTRDPVDAATDAATLAALLSERLERMFRQEQASLDLD